MFFSKILAIASLIVVSVAAPAVVEIEARENVFDEPIHHELA